jgi:cell division topological specificity factor
VVRLREEILAVIARHVTLDPDKVVVRMDRGKHVSTLEVDIELPNEPMARAS